MQWTHSVASSLLVCLQRTPPFPATGVPWLFSVALEFSLAFMFLVFILGSELGFLGLYCLTHWTSLYPPPFVSKYCFLNFMYMGIWLHICLHHLRAWYLWNWSCRPCLKKTKKKKRLNIMANMEMQSRIPVKPHNTSAMTRIKKKKKPKKTRYKCWAESWKPSILLVRFLLRIVWPFLKKSYYARPSTSASKLCGYYLPPFPSPSPFFSFLPFPSLPSFFVFERQGFSV